MICVWFSVVWPMTHELLLALDPSSSSSHCLWLTLLLREGMCGPRPPSEMGNRMICWISWKFSSDLWPSFCKLLFCCVLKNRCFSLRPRVCICPLRDIFVSAVRSQWIFSTKSRALSVKVLNLMWFCLDCSPRLKLSFVVYSYLLDSICFKEMHLINISSLVLWKPLLFQPSKWAM